MSGISHVVVILLVEIVARLEHRQELSSLVHCAGLLLLWERRYKRSGLKNEQPREEHGHSSILEIFLEKA